MNTTVLSWSRWMIDGWMIDDWWVDRAKLSRGILESCEKKLYSEESVCSIVATQNERRRRNSTSVRKHNLAKSMWTQETFYWANLLLTNKWSSWPDWLVKNRFLGDWFTCAKFSSGVQSPPGGHIQGGKTSWIWLNLRPEACLQACPHTFGHVACSDWYLWR